MNIAIVTQRFTRGDGQGRVNLEVAARALEQGHHVSLLASDADPSVRDHPNAEWVPLSLSGWPTDLARNLRFASQARRWLRQNALRLDIVQVNGCGAWLPGDVNAAHFVHSAWWKSPVHIMRLRRTPYGLYQGLNTWLNARWERPAFQGARRVVAVSEQVRAELLDIGVDGTRLRVVLNGVDLDEFHPGPADRASLGLPPEGVPLALFAGDIRTPRKNLDTVLQALVRVPALHLAVAGGTDGSPYPAMADALGLNGRVHFLGYRRDTPALMRAADIFAFPSRYEACSLVLLEALASGLPIITARTTGGAEVVGAGGILLDDADDAGALARSMQRLTGDAALRAEMGRAGRALAEQHGWTRMADQYLALYEEVYAERAGQRSAAAV